VPSRSPTPSTHASRCQGLAERSQTPPLGPLPLPVVLCCTSIGHSDSGICANSAKPGLEGGAKQTQYWGYSHCFLIQSFLICR